MVYEVIICVINSFLLTGDIIFNASDPELPPDFIFGEDADFLPEPSELPVCIKIIITVYDAIILYSKYRAFILILFYRTVVK